MHTLQRVKQSEDEQIDFFFEMVRSGSTNQTFYNTQMESINYITETIGSLNTEVDQYTADLAKFEKEVKRTKLNKGIQRGLSRKEVKNADMDKFRVSLNSLSKKSEELKQLMGRLENAIGDS